MLYEEIWFPCSSQLYRYGSKYPKFNYSVSLLYSLKLYIQVLLQILICSWLFTVFLHFVFFQVILHLPSLGHQKWSCEIIKVCTIYKILIVYQIQIFKFLIFASPFFITGSTKLWSIHIKMCFFLLQMFYLLEALWIPS